MKKVRVTALLVLTVLSTCSALAQGVRQASGEVVLLRIHDVGTGFGAPGNTIDGEVVVKLSGSSNFYGFRLRNDENSLTHQGMLDLLLDAYENDWTVTINYHSSPNRTNFLLFRVWLSR